MTKAEIVNEVAQSTGVQKEQVAAVVDGFMEVVKDSLTKGNPVYLRGFGSFIIKHTDNINSSTPLTKGYSTCLRASNSKCFLFLVPTQVVHTNKNVTTLLYTRLPSW